MAAKQVPRQKKLRSAGLRTRTRSARHPHAADLRECLARGLFAQDLPHGHREMTVAHSKQLIERYPPLPTGRRLARPSSPPFAREGFACGDGWFEIVDRLSTKLSVDPNLVVGQLRRSSVC